MPTSRRRTPDATRSDSCSRVRSGLACRYTNRTPGSTLLDVCEEILEVAGRDDLVGDEDRAARRAVARARSSSRERPLAGLHAVRHGLAGLTAEAAAALLAPPAPARGLEGETRRERVTQRARGQAREVVVVVGQRQPVQVRQRRSAREMRRPPRGARAGSRQQAGHAGERLSRQSSAHHVRQQRLCLRRPRRRRRRGSTRRSSAPITPRQLAPPKTTAVLGLCLLEARGQGQRRGVLAAHAREADQQRAGREDLGEARVEELGDLAAASRMSSSSPSSSGLLPKCGMACSGAPPARICAAYSVRRLRRRRRERRREDAVAEQVDGGPGGDVVVHAGGDHRREVDGGVEHRHPHVQRRERRLEQPQRERGLPEAAERHVDEHDAAFTIRPRRLLRRPAAVDGELGARDPARLVGGQVHVEVGDVDRLADEADRDAARRPSRSTRPA